MIYDQQDCSGGRRLYVRHPLFRKDVFKSVRLTEEQICLVKDYLDECEANNTRPTDLKIILLLDDKKNPIKFP